MSASPPLQAVRVFEAVARHGNFTRAAAELNMTQSAVSYQIRLIERHAGTILFIRQARGVALTAEGQRIFPIIRQSLLDIGNAFRNLKDDRENLLVITTMPTIANAWLAPRLGSLQMEHPNLAVRLHIGNDVMDLSAGDIDVAIRSGKGNWPGVTSHHLLDQNFIAVASPAYLAREGTPETAAALLDHVIIAPTDDWWAIWLAKAGYHRPIAFKRPGVDVETQQMSVRLALSWQGITLATPAFIRQELSQGHLLQVLDVEATSGLSYHVAYAKARADSRKIRLFRDWALGQARGNS